MRLSQAVGYFAREAATSLRRGWRVSSLAVLTIAVSLYVGGLFLLVGHNLARAAEQWRSEARLVAYLEPGASTAAGEALEAWLDERPEVARSLLVTVDEAEQRFRDAFPSLGQALAVEGVPTLPPSVEIELESDARDDLESLKQALRSRPEVDVVDDDRDWLRRLERLVVVTRTAGLLVGGLLLAAAVFTIYAVIRLTAYLYREETEVMRLVGATELMVRGPFYVEGLVQGGLGAIAAILGLLGTHAALLASDSASTVVSELLVGAFVPWQASAALLAVGGGAGLLGAALSLEREIAGSNDRRSIGD